LIESGKIGKVLSTHIVRYFIYPSSDTSEWSIQIGLNPREMAVWGPQLQKRFKCMALPNNGAYSSDVWTLIILNKCFHRRSKSAKHHRLRPSIRCFHLRPWALLLCIRNSHYPIRNCRNSQQGSHSDWRKSQKSQPRPYCCFGSAETRCTC
jgi:hypothetical protein